MVKVNQEIMRLALQGASVARIATVVRLPVVVVNAILRSPLATAELAREGKVSRV